VTQSSGTCVAITHDLKVQRDAAALVTSVDV
jgi:hypothetical protein